MRRRPRPPLFQILLHRLPSPRLRTAHRAWSWTEAGPHGRTWRRRRRAAPRAAPMGAPAAVADPADPRVPMNDKTPPRRTWRPSASSFFKFLGYAGRLGFGRHRSARHLPPRPPLARPPQTRRPGHPTAHPWPRWAHGTSSHVQAPKNRRSMEEKGAELEGSLVGLSTHKPGRPGFFFAAVFKILAAGMVLEHPWRPWTKDGVKSALRCAPGRCLRRHGV